MEEVNIGELKNFEPIDKSTSTLMKRLVEIADNISILRPMIDVELNMMSNDIFWKTVCHSIISDRLEEVSDGVHLFQCPWSNREVFDNINNPKHYMIAKDAAKSERVYEEKAQIWVNIAHLARFSMPCSFASTERCHLKNFQFEIIDKHDKWPK